MEICYAIVEHKSWEYFGIVRVCKSKQHADALIAQWGHPENAHCRCGQPAETKGHEDCSLSCGYEIEDCIFEDK